MRPSMRPRPTGSPLGPRIVAVDDDGMLLALLRDLLEGDGYQVVTHTRWQDAHELIKHSQPDVVLLDLRMGEGEMGWRVLDLLLLDPATREIPVVLCSGAVESIEARKPALLPEYGVRILTKPFDLVALERVLIELLGERPRRRLDGNMERHNHLPLTRREQELAILIARGCTNAEIAQQLVLTPGTVANHVANILNKLGAANRAQVAAWAVRVGLVRDDEPEPGG